MFFSKTLLPLASLWSVWSQQLRFHVRQGLRSNPLGEFNSQPKLKEMTEGTVEWFSCLFWLETALWGAGSFPLLGSSFFFLSFVILYAFFTVLNIYYLIKESNRRNGLTFLSHVPSPGWLLWWVLEGMFFPGGVLLAGKEWSSRWLSLCGSEFPVLWWK